MSTLKCSSSLFHSHSQWRGSNCKICSTWQWSWWQLKRVTIVIRQLFFHNTWRCICWSYLKMCIFWWWIYWGEEYGSWRRYFSWRSIQEDCHTLDHCSIVLWFSWDGQSVHYGTTLIHGVRSDVGEPICWWTIHSPKDESIGGCMTTPTRWCCS